MRIAPLFILFCSFALITKSGKLEFKPLSAGSNSSVVQQKQDIIHSEKALIALWNQLHKTETMMGDLPPKVDFSKNSVIACYMGEESNGMRIDSVTYLGTVLKIHERRAVLEPNCVDAKLLVTPFQLIEVSGSKWTSANADVTVENVECDD